MVETENILEHPLDQMIGKMLYFYDNEPLLSGWDTANFGNGNDCSLYRWVDLQYWFHKHVAKNLIVRT